MVLLYCCCSAELIEFNVTRYECSAFYMLLVVDCLLSDWTVSGACHGSGDIV
jgi:hypothetical protein